MFIIDSLLFDITVAFLLDLLLGDPVYSFHPIRLIGKSIIYMEKVCRRISKNQLLNGAIFALIIIISWGFLAFGLIRGSVELDKSIELPVLQKIISIYIIYSCISVRDLRDKAMEIKHALHNLSIVETRVKLSMIVGRETERLDESEIVRATVETVAENIVDGIISPLFFVFIGGAPLMLLYKAVNTLDSMVGYKNDRYILFGRFSARIDDVFNFVPARLALLFIPLAALAMFKNSWKALYIGLRDGGKNPSPNAGIGEAAVAGALGIRLGGTNYYHGRKSTKPFIGELRQPLMPHHIRESVGLAYWTATFTMVSGIIIYLGISLYF